MRQLKFNFCKHFKVPVKLRYPLYVRAIAFIMLFAMFHYIAGYRLLYSIGIYYTKNEAKECIVEKNNLKKLTFSMKEYNSLKWSEKGKEFEYNNQMYDIAAIQKTGNIYTVTSYADDPETEMITAFHHFESELFHPDQANKSAKSAEDILSAFQKDCTPASGFQITLAAPTRLLSPVIAAEPHLLQAIHNSIWHPPTC